MSPGGGSGTRLEGARPYALLILTLLADLALTVVRPGLGWQALRTSASYLVEIVLVLPPIFVLIGMLEVWVPRQTIVRNVGPRSGFRGLVLAVLTGSAAALRGLSRSRVASQEGLLAIQRLRAALHLGGGEDPHDHDGGEVPGLANHPSGIHMSIINVSDPIISRCHRMEFRGKWSPHGHLCREVGREGAWPGRT
ncbi:MAG TPA: hypothetical protein GX513_11355 [Firmicutes bacterium]|nr:hypothetical protein [Bacillota bacterium]